MKQMAGLVVCAVLALGPGVAAADIDTVAIQGQDSPIADFDYASFENPAVSDATDNNVAFVARAFNSALRTSRTCVFAADADSAVAVACRGDLTPSGAVVQEFGRVTINDGGTVAWSAVLNQSRTGVFTSAGGGTTVAALGDSIPGGGALSTLGPAVVTNSGGVVFRSDVVGAPPSGGVAVEDGIFRCPSGACPGGAGLETLVLTNDALPSGRRICRTAQALGASDWGIAFNAVTKMDCGDDLESSRRAVVRLQFGGTLETLALENDPADPVPVSGGTRYDSLAGNPAINDSGTVAFQATTKGLLSLQVIYVCTGSPCAAAVVQGDADADGRSFSALSLPGIDDDGAIAFSGGFRMLGGLRGSGVWKRPAGGGAPEAVAVTGQLGFDDFAFKAIRPPGMSGDGAVAFLARTQTTTDSRERLFGIFLSPAP